MLYNLVISIGGAITGSHEPEASKAVANFNPSHTIYENTVYQSFCVVSVCVGGSSVEA